MKDKTLRLLENLLSDSSFINWVKKKNKNDSSFWNLWIKNTLVRNIHNISNILCPYIAIVFKVNNFSFSWG